MTARSVKTSSMSNAPALSQKDIFFMAQGIRKRKIFYNVKYTQQQLGWIAKIRTALKKHKHLQTQEDQTLLRYYYSSNLQLQSCIQRLTNCHQWFQNKQIQTCSRQCREILKSGFIYHQGKSKEGRPMVVMNLGKLNLDSYSGTNYYQALNQVSNKVIQQQFVPGYIQTFDYILDLQQKFLTLPLTSLTDIIKKLSDVYSMRLQKMHIVNCTFASKWIYNRIQNFMSEQTINKIKLYTKEDVMNGGLLEHINADLLQVKYGGKHPDIDHQNMDFSEIVGLDDQTEYYSIEQNEDYFLQQNNYCCSGSDDACDIY